MKQKATIAIIALLLTGGASAAVVHFMREQETDTQQAVNDQTKRRDTSNTSSDGEQRTDTAERTPAEQTAPTPQQSPTPDGTDAPQQHSTHPQRGTVAPGRPLAAPARLAQPVAPSAPTPQAPHTPAPSTPQPPATPPAPHPPVVNPPATQPPIVPPEMQPPTPPQPKTDEEKAKQLAKSLKTDQNKNIAYFINHDNQHRVALWTKGITVPRLGKDGELKHEAYTANGHRYFNNQTKPMGWFDADKSKDSTATNLNLCFGAVAADQLRWWMAQNEQYITQYLAKKNYSATLPQHLAGGLKDLRIYQRSFKHQQDSAFFGTFRTYFGSNREGYRHQSRAVASTKRAGPPEFTKDARGAFFHDVFGRKLLTDRFTTSQFGHFTGRITTALKEGKSVGVIYARGGGASHAVTAWGAEFDPNGTLTALHITDSDDQTQDYNGLRRVAIKNIDGGSSHF